MSTLARWAASKRWLALAAVVAVLSAGAARAGGDPGAVHAADAERKEIKDDLAPKAKDGDVAAAKKLAAFLKHKHPLVRDDAFKALAKGDDKVLDWLVSDGLKDPDAEVRADIVELCGLAEAKRAVPALLKLLARDKENAPLIIATIGAIGSKENAPAVLAETKAGHGARAKAEAIEALAALDPDAAVEPGRAGTADSEWQVRVGSLRALARVNEDAAFDGALQNLKDRRADLDQKRKRAWQPAFTATLVVLGLEQREKRAEGLRDAIDQLVALLKLEHGRMKHEVGEAIRALTGKGDIDDDWKAWQEYWSVKRAGYAPADTPRKAAPATGAKGRKKKAKDGEEPAAEPAAAPRGEGMLGSAVRFHGISVWSDRVTFVIDLSGSMKNEIDVPEEAPAAGTAERKAPKTTRKRKLDASKEELARTVSSLPEDVHFNIVTFATDVKMWQKALSQATKAAKAAAVEFVEKLEIEGRTNYFGALSKPLEDPLVDTIFFLTDGGMTTEGKYIDQRRIVRRLHELNKYSLVEIDCLLFGTEGKVTPAARRWMEDLSGESGGHFYLKP